MPKKTQQKFFTIFFVINHFLPQKFMSLQTTNQQTEYYTLNVHLERLANLREN